VALAHRCVALLSQTRCARAVPTAPSNLTATAVSDSQINLSWTDRSNNEVAFFIERKTGPGSFTGSEGSTRTSRISAIQAHLRTPYTYRVQAANGSGFSAYSSQASATTSGPDITPPTAPTGLTATP